MILNLGDVNTEKAVKVKVPHLEDGNYYDALTGEKVVVSKHVAKIKFEANGMAVITRSKDVHPQVEISERDCMFVGGKEITLKPVNCDEAYYYFNDASSDKKNFSDTTTIQLQDYVQDGKADLHIYLRKGANEFEQTVNYSQVQLVEGKFNVINLADQYLNGDYELYIWSWSPGKWSQDYEIRDGVLLVDTTGLEGFLIAAFEKGYQIQDPNNWDAGVIKQSPDIKGELLQEGFFDMTGF